MLFLAEWKAGATVRGRLSQAGCCWSAGGGLWQIRYYEDTGVGRWPQDESQAWAIGKRIQGEIMNQQHKCSLHEWLFRCLFYLLFY